MENKNHCPVCNNIMATDEKMYYCTDCGCNIEKHSNESSPNAVSDAENFNFKNTKI